MVSQCTALDMLIEDVFALFLASLICSGFVSSVVLPTMPVLGKHLVSLLFNEGDHERS